MRHAKLLLPLLVAAAVLAAPAAAANPLKPVERRAIEGLLDRFVPAGVERRDPALAWTLVTPSFRAGITRAEWLRGELPVAPYQARGRHFDGITFVHRRPGAVDFELMLQPRSRDAGAISYSVTVVRSHRRWLIESFVPSALFAPAGRTSRIVATPDYGPHGGPDDASGHSAVWFAVPGAVFALVLLLPLGIFGRGWWRDRRAVRAYGGGSDLPPLPPRRSGQASHST